MKNVIIIGGGVAGLTCSIYLARYGFKVSIYNNYSLGSLSQTDIVQNFPGFPNGINGYDLLNNIQEQAVNCGVQIFDNKVEKINEDRSITLDDESIIKYDILVIATGMTHNKLSISNIDKYKFVHYCATCDGPLYKNKIVAIVGGGDTALSEALYLSNICSQVKLIVRKDHFRGTKYLINKIKNKSNIKIFFNSNITEINTKPYTYIKLNNQNIQKIDGLFISIGFSPNDKLFREKEFKDCFICGDCLDNPYRQAIIAAGQGAKTAMNIFKIYSK